MFYNPTVSNETNLKSEKLGVVARHLGVEEILSQTTEECGELIQAAQKMRRVLRGTTPVDESEAIRHLIEEIADVLVCIDAISCLGLVDNDKIANMASKKIDRWYNRTIEKM